MLKFIGPLIVVKDVPRSRYFYENLLGQTVKYDFGEDVQFEGIFSIHQQDHFQRLLGNEAHHTVTSKSHSFELYFETDDLEAIQQRLKAAGVEFIHEIQAQPWGQRVMRFYDPDGHVIEIGESLETVVLRFHRQGLSDEEVSRKSSMPVSFVEEVIREHGG